MLKVKVKTYSLQVRQYHNINNKTSVLGEYAWPGKHHVMLTAEDEQYAYGHILLKNLKVPKYDKEEVYKDKRKLDNINNRNWYIGKNQDCRSIPCIPLRDIITDDTGSIPFHSQTEVTYIAFKILKKDINEYNSNTGFFEDRNNKINERIINSYSIEEGRTQIPYFDPVSREYGNMEFENVGSIKPQNYNQSPIKVALDIEKILKDYDF